MCRTLGIYLVLFFVFFKLTAQKPVLIHENYNNQRFIDVVQSIEEKYGVHFFFNEQWFDNIKISQPTAPVTLEELIKKTLFFTDLKFYFDKNQHIIITKGYEIQEYVEVGIPDKDLTMMKVPSYARKDVEKKITNSHADENGAVVIGNPGSNKSEVIISGFIREDDTGEPMVGSVVYVEDMEIGTTSDGSGYFFLKVPYGRHIISFHSLGKKDIQKHVLAYNDGTLNVDMQEQVTQLGGVTVTAEKYQNVSGMQIGMDKLEIETIKQIPMSMGETDILKSALLLPGVQTVGEGASGFNVRGGATDQNLILLNGAPVFNTSHLFGFFSAFNPDIVSDFKLFKSWIPAQYGGRLSSVFDIASKNGNRKKFTGGAGISPVTGKAYIEGPIIKNKCSFIAAGRTTYSDWILKQLKDPDIRNSKAAFYDVFGKVTYDINQSNSINMSGYYSSDFFRLNSHTTYQYKNKNAVMGWKHIFNNNFYANFSAIYSTYAYQVVEDENEVNAYKLSYDIDYRELKADVSYFPSINHKISFGASSNMYKLNPGSYLPHGGESLVVPNIMEKETANESAVYVSDEWSVNSKISLYGGIRYSYFMFLGPKNVYDYENNIPRGEMSISDTSFYSKNELIENYSNPEFRFSFRYKINGKNSVKIGFNRMSQYLHMLSNTTAISPTDTWKLSDKYIPPQQGDQYAVGYYRDLLDKKMEASVEVYYKEIKNLIEYRGGARLIMNDKIENDLISGTGKAYGVECLVKKDIGKFNGWASYTYSRMLVKADSRFADLRINEGEFFPVNHDKPHDITAVANYKFSRRLNFSANYTFSTGRPITYPVGKYKIRNYTLLHYTNRNEFRIDDYQRLDLAINLDGNLKAEKIGHSSWSLSVYNLLGRRNAYSIYFVSSGGELNGYKMSIFGQPIYTLSYQVKF